MGEPIKNARVIIIPKVTPTIMNRFLFTLCSKKCPDKNERIGFGTSL